MSKKEARLAEMCIPIVQAMGYDYWGSEYFSQGSRSIVRVYIEREAGVNVDDCSKVSRQLGALLDVEELFRSAYTLEVSSPGLERPLFNLAQCERFVGQPIAVRLYAPLNKRRNYAGCLLKIDGDALVLQVDDEAVNFPFSTIAKAKLVAEV